MLGWLLLVAGGADVFCSDRWLDTTLEGKTYLWLMEDKDSNTLSKDLSIACNRFQIPGCGN